MWVIVHTMTGMALGALLPGLPLPVVIAAVLVLHLLLDLVPHWDYTGHRHRKLLAALDVLASISALALARMLSVDHVVILAGLIGALPDPLDISLGYLHLPVRFRLFPSHWRSYPHGTCARKPGIAVQLAICALSAALLILFSR